MVDKNIRFREPRLPPEVLPSFWYKSTFEYAGSIYAVGVGNSQYGGLDVARLRREGSSVVWSQVLAFHYTHPAVFQALQLWGSGYSDSGMSLAEFLNETVPL